MAKKETSPKDKKEKKKTKQNGSNKNTSELKPTPNKSMLMDARSETPSDFSKQTESASGNRVAREPRCVDFQNQRPKMPDSTREEILKLLNEEYKPSGQHLDIQDQIINKSISQKYSSRMTTIPQPFNLGSELYNTTRRNSSINSIIKWIIAGAVVIATIIIVWVFY